MTIAANPGEKEGGRAVEGKEESPGNQHIWPHYVIYYTTIRNHIEHDDVVSEWHVILISHPFCEGCAPRHKHFHMVTTRSGQATLSQCVHNVHKAGVRYGIVWYEV